MKSGLFNFETAGGSIPPGSITNADLADMPARSVKANPTNAADEPQDLVGTTPLNYLRVNAAGNGLEWGALPVDPGLVTSVFGRTGAIGPVAGDYNAAEISNSPHGGISALNVQSAINELEDDKLNISAAATAAQARAATATSVYLTPANLAQRGAFKAGLAADQTGIADSTATKVMFAVEAFDTGGWYDNTTNYRWTPQSAVLIGIEAGARCAGTFPAGNIASVQIYKNGAAFVNSVPFLSPSANDNRTLAATTDIPNGTTDYYEAYVYIDTTTGTGEVSNNPSSFFLGMQQ